jgi:Serine aminopeptidase, S33
MTGMDDRVRSGGLRLAAHIARPSGRASGPLPAVVLCHGYPGVTESSAIAPHTFPELADRIATEMGWVALALALRGCGESEGQFSLGGWLDDLLAAADHLEREEQPLGVWLAGFGTGGALAICAGARDPRIRGVAALGAPACSSTAARSASSSTASTRPRSRPGPRTTGPSGPSPACRSTRPGRCWSPTGARTTWSRRSTPGCWSTPTARPSCAWSTAPATGFVTIPGPSPSSSAGSIASATSSAAEIHRRTWHRNSRRTAVSVPSSLAISRLCPCPGLAWPASRRGPGRRPRGSRCRRPSGAGRRRRDGWPPPSPPA